MYAGGQTTSLAPTSSGAALGKADELLKKAGSTPGDTMTLVSMEVEIGNNDCFVKGHVKRLDGGKIVEPDPSVAVTCPIARGLLSDQRAYTERVRALLEHRKQVEADGKPIDKKYVEATLANIRDAIIRQGTFKAAAVTKAYESLVDKFKKGKIPKGEYNLNDLTRLYDEALSMGGSGVTGNFNMDSGDNDEAGFGDMMKSGW